jgi:hypothetical protein
MDQVRHYLKLAMYAGAIICYVMVLWQFLMHKQWKLVLLSLLCNIVLLGGFLVALIIGWQEAANWKMKRLMIIFSVLLPLCMISLMRDEWRRMTEPPPVVKAKKGAVRVAPSGPAK